MNGPKVVTQAGACPGLALAVNKPGRLGNAVNLLESGVDAVCFVALEALECEWQSQTGEA